MNDTAPPDAPPRDASLGSVQTLASWPPPVSDPIVPKRVCFYKSGDPQFSGIRMVISGRNFKTFDALLDSLSQKVPLPYGVRNITTPRGTHPLNSLDQLEDGKSYLCSDQKKVKPIDLEMAGSKLLPWNASLPAKRGRRSAQQSATGEGRPAKRESLVALRVPRRLTIFRNGDSHLRRTVLLQRKNAQTFEAVLSFISEVLGFPVVNLHTTDGRMIDDLPALLLYSGAVVASGDEPFRSVSYDLQKPTQSTQSSSHMEPSRLQPRSRKSNSLSRSSRNFSPSSERYFANQIHGSMSGSLFEPRSNPVGSMDAERDMAETSAFMPPDDDIEKSFRVNQDGSMTVEMKVRLMIKQEETIHWTTTLLRSSLTGQQGGASAPQGVPEGNSPDSNGSPPGDPKDGSVQRPKVRMAVSTAGTEDVFDEGEEAVPAPAAGAEKPRVWRPPTPGPRRPREKTLPSEGSINTLSAIEVQENIAGAFSYTEQAPGGAVVEKHSTRPTPKPRSAVPMGTDQAEVHSTFRSSRSAEILQIQNTVGEVTESVLHVYEQQSCYDSYFGNTQVSGECQSVSRMVCSRTVSMDTAPRSSSNDDDTPHRKPSITPESLNGRKPGTQSPSSDVMAPLNKIRNDLSSFTDNEAHAAVDSPSELSLQDTDGSGRPAPKDPAGRSIPQGKKKSEKPRVKKKAALLSITPDIPRTEGRALGDSRLVKSSSDIASHTDPNKSNERARQGVKNDQKPGKTNKKKKGRGNGDVTPRRQALSLNIEHPKESVKQLNLMDEGSTGETALYTSTEGTVSPGSKNKLNVLPPRKTLVKQRSMNEDGRGVKESVELNESVSLPMLHFAPTAVNEYVENWLENMQGDSASCTGDGNDSTSEPASKVMFRIGSDSPEELEEKSETGTLSEDHLTYEHGVTNRTTSHVPTEEWHEQGSRTRIKGESRVKKSLGISKSEVCMKSAVGVPEIKTHKSAQALAQTGKEPSFTSKLATEPKIKPMLDQLCLSIRSISQVSQSRRLSCLEKSHSVPDFSSHVASTFGASSKVLVAFLSVMSFKEGIEGLSKDQSLAKDSSCSEALQMLKALHKMTSIENADELKNSLSELQRSASSHLLQRWRSFQVISNRTESQDASLGNSDHMFPSETSLEEINKHDEQPLCIQELMDELGISKDLQKELSSLVKGEMNDFNRKEELTEKSEESNSFVESVTKGEVDDFTESVYEKEIDGFTGSVLEEDVNYLTESVPEKETDGFTESVHEKEIDGFTESVLEEDVNYLTESVPEKETDGFTESVHEEDVEYFTESALEKETDGFTESVKEIESVHEEEVEYFTESAPEKETDGFTESVKETESVQEEEVEYFTESVHEKEIESVYEEEVEYFTESVHEKEIESVYEEDVGYFKESVQEKETDGFTESVYEKERDSFTESVQEKEIDRSVGSVQEKDVYDCEASDAEKEINGIAQSIEEKEVDNSAESATEEDKTVEPSCSGSSPLCVSAEEDSQHHMCSTLEEASYLAEKGNSEELVKAVMHSYAEGGAKGVQGNACLGQMDVVSEASEVDGGCSVSCLSSTEHSKTEEFMGDDSEVHRGLDREDGAKLQAVREEAEELGYETIYHSVNIPDHLLGFVSSVLMSSSLVFCYDSKGNLRIVPDDTCAADMYSAESNIHPQYGQVRLPSPNTSDLSDYRGETTDSDERSSQLSVELSAESAGEHSGRQAITQGCEDTFSRGKDDDVLESEQRHPEGGCCADSLISDSESKPEEMADISYFNTTGSVDLQSELPQCPGPQAEADMSDGVLIDKGRWLLKENHLIRKSPPIPQGMYGNADTTSVDTSDDVPYAYVGNHCAAMEVISSSELEELTRPATPKCTYFNMPHGSDSEPFQDNLSVSSRTRMKPSSPRKKKDSKVSPSADASQETWAKKRDSLGSFTSVEFKLAGNKVHPQAGPSRPPEVTQPGRSEGDANRSLKEQDSLEKLHLVCGQHCPIL